MFKLWKRQLHFYEERDSYISNEVSVFGKSDSHMAYWREGGQRKTTKNLTSEFVYMGAIIQFRWVNKNTFIRSYKGQEIDVKGQDT